MKHRILSKQSGTFQRVSVETPHRNGDADTAKTVVPETSASNADSKDQAADVKPSATATRSIVLFETKSGLDITHRVIELLWRASQRSRLTFEMVHQAFSGDHLTPDEMTAVCQTLMEAGVHLVEASVIESVQRGTHPAAEEPVHLKTQGVSAQNCVPRTEDPQSVPRETENELTRTMGSADHEMRHIFCSFGFAAHEHLSRAEKLLAHPSEASFERLVVDSETMNRAQYVRMLPNLVRRVRALEQRTAAAYRAWRQALGQHNEEEHRIEFRRFDHQLQQTLPMFWYQLKVIQEMIATAQNIATQFEASQRVLQQAQRTGDSVRQGSLVDVERQTIEAIEELVRMPGEVFLRNCDQLNAAATRFQRARCELIQDHLHLVASIARTYSNRGLTSAKLVREGIFGLIRAVEKFGYGHEQRFSTFAGCWIRQCMRAALAAQQRPAQRPPPPAASEDHSNARQPEEEALLQNP